MTRYNLISFVGLGAVMFLGWLISRNRWRINWRLIVWGTVFQLLFAAFVFQVPAGRKVLWAASEVVGKLIASGNAGAKFVFGPLAEDKPLGFMLAFQGFPAIIFFSALMAVLYYVRIMPLIVRSFAWVFTKVMRVSGAESLYAASQIFGGVESATAIRPYLRRMTNSELHCLITAGMATVAVNVLALYVGFLKDLFHDIAGHLICASILGAPAALIMAKIVWPEDAEPETLGRVPPITLEGTSGLTDSVIAGAMDGVRLIVGIVALLIAFLGLLHLANWILMAAAGTSLEVLLGHVFRPLSFLMGVPWEHADEVGRLLGLRTVATEVVSYQQLAELIREHKIDARSAVICAYALCGFTHVASMAIFVGGTAALIPERRGDLAKVAFRALIAGTLATLIVGAVVGVCYTHQPVFLTPGQ